MYSTPTQGFVGAPVGLALRLTCPRWLYRPQCESRPTLTRRANVGERAASSLVFGKQVTLHTHGHDKYQRTLGDVILLDGVNLNQELVKQGWCWWYRKYAPGDTVLEELEKVAREGKKGLWADPKPVPPWEWRKR